MGVRAPPTITMSVFMEFDGCLWVCSLCWALGSVGLAAGVTAP